MTSESSPLLPDFDTLAKLAKDDPQAFEALRQSLVDDLIDHAPQAKRARLRGLQFRVDAIRQLSKSELGAAVKIYELMWRSFRSLANEWTSLRNGTGRALPYRRRPAAKVLPLPPRPHH
jgi:uncharacterized protein DUF3135